MRANVYCVFIWVKCMFARLMTDRVMSSINKINLV